MRWIVIFSLFAVLIVFFQNAGLVKPLKFPTYFASIYKDGLPKDELKDLNYYQQELQNSPFIKKSERMLNRRSPNSSQNGQAEDQCHVQEDGSLKCNEPEEDNWEFKIDPSRGLASVQMADGVKTTIGVNPWGKSELSVRGKIGASSELCLTVDDKSQMTRVGLDVQF